MIIILIKVATSMCVSGDLKVVKKIYAQCLTIMNRWQSYILVLYLRPTALFTWVSFERLWKLENQHSNFQDGSLSIKYYWILGTKTVLSLHRYILKTTDILKISFKISRKKWWNDSGRLLYKIYLKFKDLFFWFDEKGLSNEWGVKRGFKDFWKCLLNYQKFLIDIET